MENNSVIVATPAELRRIVSEEVNNVLPKLADFRRKNEAVETDAMTVEAAAKFLTAQGIPSTRATLYNLVYKNTIPHRKFGRRTVFSKRELTQWIEDNIRRPATKEDAAKRIAASANRKKL